MKAASSVNFPAVLEEGVFRAYLTPAEVSRFLESLRARTDVRVEDVRGPPYTAVRRMYVLHFPDAVAEVWQVADHLEFRRKGSSDNAPHTLAELRRRLDAAPTLALLIIPASLDHSVVDAHFPGFFDDKAIGFPNGSSLRILRGRPNPRDVIPVPIDVALVLTAVPNDTLAEIRRRLLATGGALFAPFAVDD